MRVMVFVPGDKDSEAGKMPSEELIGRMMKFNEDLVKAGVMLAGDGLHPTSKAKKVRFHGKERVVITRVPDWRVRLEDLELVGSYPPDSWVRVGSFAH
jgi:hypothetical protein